MHAADLLVSCLVVRDNERGARLFIVDCHELHEFVLDVSRPSRFVVAEIFVKVKSHHASTV